MLSIWLRLRTYWRRRQLDRDVEDEVAVHLETRRARLMAAGATPAQASIQARRAFGTELRAAEGLREAWFIRWLDDLRRDLAFAARAFSRSPVFALTAVLSLALGIGASTAIYAAGYSLLWRPMPVERPDRLVALYQTGPNGLEDSRNFSYPELLDYARQVGDFTDLMGSTGVPLRVRWGTGPELVWGQVVTDNFFSGLLLDMAAGRGFLPRESGPVAVLSYPFWQRRFQGDPTVVGKSIEVNGHALTIVGVTARGFTSTQLFNYVPDVSIPLSAQRIVLPNEGNWMEGRDNRWLTVRGRLRPGVSLAQAEAGLNVVSARLARQYPDTNRHFTVHVIPGGTRTHAYLVASGAIGVIVMVVGGSVVLLLLIACTNVANLVLARSASRGQEMATRIAIGAGRARLVRQLLTEGLLLALAGGGVGLVVARLVGSLLWSFYPSLDFMTVDPSYDSAIDGSAYLFAFGVSVATAVLFSLGPALRASKGDQMSAIRDRRMRVAPLLVTAQVALCSVLLVAGGLFLRSLQYAESADPGFDRDGLLIFMVDLDIQGYPKDRGLAFQRDFARRLKALPGVTSVAIASPMPLGPEDEGFGFRVHGHVPAANESMSAGLTCAGPGYFSTVGTRIVAGRALLESDDAAAPPVVVVNETFARRYWQTPERAVGQRLGFARGKEWIEIVGVAADGKYATFGEAPQPYAFFPILQQYRGRISVLLRTSQSAAAVLSGVRAAARALDPEVPVLGMKTIRQYLERLLSIYQVGAVLLGMFAVCALLLASVGLFGLLHFTVTRRTREIGIRMALGAAGRDVALSVVRSGMLLVAPGLLIGLAGAMAMGGLLGQIVAGVDGRDPATYGAVAVVTLAVGVAAALIPARRTTAIDPVRALHCE